MSVNSTTRRLRASALLTGAALAGSVFAAGSVAADTLAPIEHLGSFFVTTNLAEGEDQATPTSAEIVDVTDDGATAVYTDGVAGRVGFVDISDPTAPAPLGAIDVGDPTSAGIVGDYLLVSTNTSEDFANPSGELLVIDLASREVLATLPLSGQPDAVAIAPSGSLRRGRHRERARRGPRRRAHPASACRHPRHHRPRAAIPPSGPCAVSTSPASPRRHRMIPSRSSWTSTASTRRS